MALAQYQQDFFAKFVPLAQAEQARSGLPASLLIAQAITESGWGKSDLAAKYNNFFGIKTSKEWTGRTVFMTGKYHGDSGTYRVYDNPVIGVQNRTEFFERNSRYSDLLKMNDSLAMADELQRVGYAEDKNYAANLKSLINGYNLKQYDDPNAKYNPSTAVNTGSTPHSGSSGSFGDSGSGSGSAPSTSMFGLGTVFGVNMDRIATITLAFMLGILLIGSGIFITFRGA